jgi:hypothetical protein
MSYDPVNAMKDDVTAKPYAVQVSINQSSNLIGVRITSGSVTRRA